MPFKKVYLYQPFSFDGCHPSALILACKLNFFQMLLSLLFLQNKTSAAVGIVSGEAKEKARKHFINSHDIIDCYANHDFIVVIIIVTHTIVSLLPHCQFSSTTSCTTCMHLYHLLNRRHSVPSPPN